MKGKKVLIVDDAYFMRGLIKKELIGFGCEVVGEAKNGKDAINLYKKLNPDIVTMDIHMPELDGLEAIRKIKEINPSAKILVITGDFESEVKAFKAGATDFLRKPFQPAFLWTKIENIIKVIDYTSTEDDLLAGELEVEVNDRDKPLEDKTVILNDEAEEDDLLFPTISSHKSTLSNFNKNAIDNATDNLKLEDIEFEVINEHIDEEFIVVNEEATINNLDVEEDNDNIPYNIFQNKRDENVLSEENVIKMIENNVSVIDNNNDEYVSNVVDRDDEDMFEREREEEEEEEEVISISIKPPRAGRDFNRNQHKNYNGEDELEEPMINSVNNESFEDKPKNIGLFSKLKNMLK